tara:strand:- start:48 stop:2924 length:2877 start_codon:yes stop_codon:yes gene_type:complete
MEEHAYTILHPLSLALIAESSSSRVVDTPRAWRDFIDAVRAAGRASRGFVWIASAQSNARVLLTFTTEWEEAGEEEEKLGARAAAVRMDELARRLQPGGAALDLDLSPTAPPLTLAALRDAMDTARWSVPSGAFEMTLTEPTPWGIAFSTAAASAATGAAPSIVVSRLDANGAARRSFGGVAVGDRLVAVESVGAPFETRGRTYWDAMLTLSDVGARCSAARPVTLCLEATQSGSTVSTAAGGVSAVYCGPRLHLVMHRDPLALGGAFLVRAASLPSGLFAEACAQVELTHVNGEPLDSSSSNSAIEVAERIAKLTRAHPAVLLHLRFGAQRLLDGALTAATATATAPTLAVEAEAKESLRVAGLPVAISQSSRRSCSLSAAPPLPLGDAKRLLGSASAPRETGWSPHSPLTPHSPVASPRQGPPSPLHIEVEEEAELPLLPSSSSSTAPPPSPPSLRHTKESRSSSAVRVAENSPPTNAAALLLETSQRRIIEKKKKNAEGAESWKAAIRPNFHLFKLNGERVTSAKQVETDLRHAQALSSADGTPHRAVLEFIDHHGHTRRPVRCSVEYASNIDVSRVLSTAPRQRRSISSSSSSSSRRRWSDGTSFSSGGEAVDAAQLRLQLCLTIGQWRQRRITKSIPVAADHSSKTLDMRWFDGDCWSQDEEGVAAEYAARQQHARRGGAAAGTSGHRSGTRVLELREPGTVQIPHLLPLKSDAEEDEARRAVHLDPSSRAGSSKEHIALTVVDVHGRFYYASMRRSDSVRALKLQIQLLEGSPPDQQVLFHVESGTRIDVGPRRVQEETPLSAAGRGALTSAMALSPPGAAVRIVMLPPFSLSVEVEYRLTGSLVWVRTGQVARVGEENVALGRILMPRSASPAGTVAQMATISCAWRSSGSGSGNGPDVATVGGVRLELCPASHTWECDVPARQVSPLHGFKVFDSTDSSRVLLLSHAEPE